MKWIKVNATFWDHLKEGTICRTTNGDFIIVGKINTSMGVNDEFTEDITHYTEDYINDIKLIIDRAKSDFLNNL